jgi:eukaryotic-like serine/threonine-protein kinase
VGYAAPEQLMQQPVDRRADVFSAGVVLWEALTGKRLFRSAESRDAFLNGTSRNILPASAFNAEVPRSLDEVVFRALGWLPEERYDTAGEFAQELELAVSPASRAEITAYVEKKAAANLKSQRALLSAIDAPSGRISEPPGSSSSDAYEDETVVFRPDHHLLHLGVPKRKETASVPSPLDVLRERLSTALERDSSASLFGFTSRVSGSLRRSARRVGSNVLAAAAAVLLMLAAVKLSRGTPSLAPDAVPSPAQPAPESARAIQEPNQPARRVAAASIDFTPPDPWEKAEPARQAAEPPPAPPAETSDRDRPRAKAIVRRAPAADRGSCDPPFTVDGSGIKRLKVHCL